VKVAPDDELKQLTSLVVDFRDRRDWAQFHHPKELASALAIEVAEIMELFRFKTAQEVRELLGEPSAQEELGAELADSLFLLLLLSYESGVDLRRAFEQKLELLEERYPVDKVKGKSAKWTEYQPDGTATVGDAKPK
jgi:dCTP diphosphatase